MSRSPLLPIFLTVFVDVLGLTMMLPLLPFYAEHFGASPQVVTILGASYAACQLVAGPVLGRLSDRIGRKPVLLVSQTGTFLSLLVIGSASQTVGAVGLAMLFAGRIIDGLTAGNLSIAQAYISDVTRPENRTRAFGLIGVAFGVGFFIGPAMSGWVADNFGYGAPAYGAAVLSFLSIVLTATLLPGKAALAKLKADQGPVSADAPPAPAGARTLSFGKFLARPLPRRRLLQFFAFTTAFAVVTGGLALFLERRFGFGLKEVGYVFMVPGLLGLIIQGGLLGRLVRWLGEPRLALLGFISMAAAYPLLWFAPTVLLFVGLMCVASFGVAVIRPCLTTLLTKSVGRHEQGAALGASQSLASISQMIGQPLAGFLIGHGRLDLWGVAAGAIASVGVLLLLSPAPTADGVVGSTSAP